MTEATGPNTSSRLMVIAGGVFVTNAGARKYPSVTDCTRSPPYTEPPSLRASAIPTQALLDMYTIRHYKRDFSRLTVAIVGDVLHSRVARSDIHALTTLGCPEVRVVGPKTLVPPDLAAMGVRVCHSLEEGLRGCDVVIMLRLQNERMSGALLPSSQEYFKSYGLTPQKLALARPDAIVMHPGPINRGVEIVSLEAARRGRGWSRRCRIAGKYIVGLGRSVARRWCHACGDSRRR